MNSTHCFLSSCDTVKSLSLSLILSGTPVDSFEREEGRRVGRRASRHPHSFRWLMMYLSISEKLHTSHILSDSKGLEIAQPAWSLLELLSFTRLFQLHVEHVLLLKGGLSLSRHGPVYQAPVHDASRRRGIRHGPRTALPRSA